MHIFARRSTFPHCLKLDLLFACRGVSMGAHDCFLLPNSPWFPTSPTINWDTCKLSHSVWFLLADSRSQEDFRDSANVLSAREVIWLRISDARPLIYPD